MGLAQCTLVGAGVQGVQSRAVVERVISAVWRSHSTLSPRRWRYCGQKDLRMLLGHRAPL